MDENIFRDYKPNYNYRNKLLKHFKDKGEILQYSARAFIEWENENLDYVYLILEGKVKQYFISYSGNEKTIFLLIKGDMFGEISMIQEDCKFLISETLTPTTLCRISKYTFLDSLDNSPSISYNVHLMTTTKLRILMTQLYDISFFESKYRLYFLLKRIASNQSIEHEYGRLINLKNLTHQDLATMIGSTRSTVTKLLKELEDEKKIIRNGKNIIIINDN